uniref:N-glycosylase/DNA lyase n=1 Tax=Sinocyclocheilus rhinocerous TaxID=307959 RepID=A0A673NFP3_9TELE
CGQTFRWRETANGQWTGVMRGKVWTLTQTEDTLWYYVYSHQIDPGTENRQKWKVEDEEQLLGKMSRRKIDMKQEEVGLCTVIDNFQLGVKLGDFYSDWSTVDHTSNIQRGVILRLLHQDPVECLFSFICSSNNHISQIQGMVDRLCQTLGTLLCKLDDVVYHDFPPLQALTGSYTSAHSTDMQYLDALRTLPGVGLKVIAYCVCLMSLDKFEALPVDTHVWQIAKRDYSFAAGSSQKTLTDRVYKEIGDFFRKIWGPYADWAHSVLFCADLKRFQKLKEEIPVLKDDKTKLKKKMKARRHDRYEEKQSKKGKKHQRT